MGRHHQHLRLPRDLYLSPPPPPPSNFSLSSSSLLALKSAIYFTFTVPLLQSSSPAKTFAVSDRIPGLKTSAAFLSTLRANIILDLETPPPSLANTPDSLRPVEACHLPALSQLGTSPLAQPLDMVDSDAAAADQLANPLAGLPELKTKVVTTEDDKIEALHQIADSVAQQRQLASSAIIFHPFTISAMVLFFGLIYQYLYKGQTSDWAIIGTTSAGVLMAVLISVRWATGGYIFEAERIGTWKWLDEGRDAADNGILGSHDEILMTFYGEEPIGTIVIRGVREPGNKRKNSPTTGVIRAWTVLRKFRRKGIGQGLLEEAIAFCQSKGWSGPVFDDKHANSAILVPATFAGGFGKRDKQAREMLQRTIDEVTATSGKKGKR